MMREWLLGMWSPFTRLQCADGTEHAIPFVALHCFESISPGGQCMGDHLAIMVGVTNFNFRKGHRIYHHGSYIMIGPEGWEMQLPTLALPHDKMIVPPDQCQ